MFCPKTSAMLMCICIVFFALAFGDQIDDNFALSDHNGDGRISPEEFLSTAENVTMIAVDDSGRLFEANDENNDGFLDAAEYRRLDEQDRKEQRGNVID